MQTFYSAMHCVSIAEDVYRPARVSNAVRDAPLSSPQGSGTI